MPLLSCLINNTCKIMHWNGHQHVVCVCMRARAHMCACTRVCICLGHRSFTWNERWTHAHVSKKKKKTVSYYGCTAAVCVSYMHTLSLLEVIIRLAFTVRIYWGWFVDHLMLETVLRWSTQTVNKSSTQLEAKQNGWDGFVAMVAKKTSRASIG